MRWTNQDLLRALRQVTQVNVPLAEFEYLYDPLWINDGEIDPNVLSAGGFPVTVSRRILNIVAETRKENASNLLIDESIIKEASKQIRQIDTAISRSVSREIATQLLSNFYVLETSQITLTFPQLQAWLANVKTIIGDIQTIRPDLSTQDLLLSLSADITAISRVVPEVWAQWRISLVEQMWETIDRGEEIGPFNNDFLITVQQFLKTFCQSSGLQASINNYSSDKPITIFKVEWEADLGYATAWLLQHEKPELEVKVKLDLFVNTGFVSDIPLSAFEIGLSKKQRSLIKRLLQSGKFMETEESCELRSPKLDQKVNISWNKASQKTNIHFKDYGSLLLSNVSPVRQNLNQVYNADAFSWNYAQLKQLNWTNSSQRYMFLANLLNAKAATITIYEQMEARFGCGHRHPTSQIVPLCQTQASIWNNERFVLKEGGVCSAGGNDVDVVASKNFQVAVLQRQVESRLFAFKGRDLHGHVRCLAVIDLDGRVTKLGFVVKLSTKESENSSAYLSFRLVFDAKGKFITGDEVTKSGIKYFDNLKDYGLQPLLNVSELKKLFTATYRNWLVSMLYLNEFVSSDVPSKIANFVDQGVVVPSFWPINGIVDRETIEEEMLVNPAQNNQVFNRDWRNQNIRPIRGKKYGKGDLWPPQPKFIKVL